VGEAAPNPGRAAACATWMEGSEVIGKIFGVLIELMIVYMIFGALVQMALDEWSYNWPRRIYRAVRDRSLPQRDCNE